MHEINIGRNNRIFISYKNKNKIIIKKYKKKYSTKFDRFLSEKKFIEFLKKKKIHNIPQIISSNKKDKINIFNFIEGRHIKQIEKKHLNLCLDFLKKINKNTNYKNFRFQKASDSCLSIFEHIQSCSTRIKKFIKIYQKKKNIYDKKIYNFLIKKIQPSFKKVIKEINQNFTTYQKKNRIKESHMILSPSDFGFHNILISKNKTIFIDFEYAGWDDPNKLLCDFILNPDYSISNTNQFYFLKKFSKIFKNKFSLSKKFHILKKLHFLKWVCVIISHIDKKKTNYKYFIKAKKYFNKNKVIIK